MEIISRSDAIQAGMKRYFTGEPCAAGHVVQRYVCDSKCCECVGQKQRDRNKDREFRDRKNLRMKESGYAAAYGKRYAEENEIRLTESRRGNRIRDRELRINRPKNESRWARAKRNAVKRVREALLTQLSRDVGCDAQEFKRFIEAKFRKGMTWENYGVEWEVDHIVPLAKFDLTSREGLAAAGHYTNLQPLWIEENAEKSDTLPARHQPELAIGFSHG
jgi:hypothetical protein